MTCSIAFPFEVLRGEAPTVADVKTDLLVHHFIDGKLYRITAWLPHDGFAELKDGLIAKYGEPTSAATETLQNQFGAKFESESVTWRNDTSTITLSERAGKLDTSLLLFEHHDLGLK